METLQIRAGNHDDGNGYASTLERDDSKTGTDIGGDIMVTYLDGRQRMKDNRKFTLIERRARLRRQESRHGPKGIFVARTCMIVSATSHGDDKKPSNAICDYRLNGGTVDKKER